MSICLVKTYLKSINMTCIIKGMTPFAILNRKKHFFIINAFHQSFMFSVSTIWILYDITQSCINEYLLKWMPVQRILLSKQCLYRYSAEYIENAQRFSGRENTHPLRLRV